MSKTKAPALLFDLDGTLVHSDPIHFVVFRDIFAEHGVSLEWDEFTTEVVGRPNPEIFAHFLPEQAHRAAELADRKEAEFRSRLTGSFEPTPGILGLLDWAERSGAPFAVVTNAPRANAEAMLSASGLAARFEMVIAEGDAPQAKPDPAPYLLAMERLGVAPRPRSPSRIRARATAPPAPRAPMSSASPPTSPQRRCCRPGPIRLSQTSTILPSGHISINEGPDVS